jgi:hypothetical protein
MAEQGTKKGVQLLTVMGTREAACCSWTAWRIAARLGSKNASTSDLERGIQISRIFTRSGVTYPWSFN